VQTTPGGWGVGVWDCPECNEHVALEPRRGGERARCLAFGTTNVCR
jgi:hypothetical protein